MASPNRKLSDSTAITAPYRLAGNQCAATFTRPPQPADWTKRFTAHATTNTRTVDPAPNASVAATDPNKPARNIGRPPAKSPARPLASFPTAYDRTPMELMAPIVRRSMPDD